MLRALGARLLFAIALVVLAFAGAYVLTALAPGDAVPDAGSFASQASLDAQRARLGLDRPVLVRLGERLLGLLRLDLGTSLLYARPVLPLVVERAAATAQTGVSALLLAVLLGVPAGVMAARTRSPLLGRAIAIVSLVVLSVPALVLALLLSLVAVTAGVPPFAVVVGALTLPAAALLERLQSRAMEGTLDDPCLVAVRSRGVPEHRVIWRHAWPLSLPPVLGVAGIIASHLVSGSLAVELVTAWPGLGRLTFDALIARDADLVAGCAGAAAALVGAATFVADALQLVLDPRTTSS